jgi:AcrR family transcriptional regulator
VGVVTGEGGVEPARASSSVWLRPERAARGPVPEYSRARIAAAGIALADEGGLITVSMRRVAAAIGTAPASLYRYVANREELVLVMADQVLGELRYPEPTGEDWLAELLAVARQQLELFRRHPWLLELSGGGAGTLSPSVADFLEHTLAVLAGLDLPAATKLEAVAMMTGVVSLFARDELLRERGHTTVEGQRATAAYLTQVAAQGRHPQLIAALTSAGPARASADQGEMFDRVLSGVLTGLLRRT